MLITKNGSDARAVMKAPGGKHAHKAAKSQPQSQPQPQPQSQLPHAERPRSQPQSQPQPQPQQPAPATTTAGSTPQSVSSDSSPSASATSSRQTITLSFAGALVLLLALVGCVHSSGKRPKASREGGGEGGEGSGGGGPLEVSDEARTRALCVGFLCLQYAMYALLRRYATGILREDWSFASVLGAGAFQEAMPHSTGARRPS